MDYSVQTFRCYVDQEPLISSIICNHQLMPVESYLHGLLRDSLLSICSLFKKVAFLHASSLVNCKLFWTMALTLCDSNLKEDGLGLYAGSLADLMVGFVISLPF